MGYWSSHKYKRRSVEVDVKAFEGWNRVIDLVKRARVIGDARADHNGERDSNLLTALFLGGFRVSEVVKERFFKDGVVEVISGLKRENLKLKEDFNPPHMLFENVLALKGHRKIRGTDTIDEEGHKHWQTKRIPLYRIFPIPVDEPLVDEFLAYLNNFKDTDYLFPMTRIRAYQIILAVDKSIWPHWFRSQRASQLAREYGWDLNKLLDFFQWKDLKTGARYASMGYSGLLDALPKGKVARVW